MHASHRIHPSNGKPGSGQFWRSAPCFQQRQVVILVKPQTKPTQPWRTTLLMTCWGGSMRQWGRRMRITTPRRSPSAVAASIAPTLGPIRATTKSSTAIATITLVLLLAAKSTPSTPGSTTTTTTTTTNSKKKTEDINGLRRTALLTPEK